MATLCPSVRHELPREVMAMLLAARPMLALAWSLAVAEGIAARIRAFFASPGGAGHQANSGR